jgi:hypothetical protein
MPYAPHYAMQALEFILAGAAAPAEDMKAGSEAELRKKVWGPYGPFDAYSLRDRWVSGNYLAIDQLPIVCMVENYRSGLLWNLFMSDPDVRAGLAGAGIREPEFAAGFPEAVVTLKRDGRQYVPDACDIRRHPDSGLYAIPYWTVRAAPVELRLTDAAGVLLLRGEREALRGRNYFSFPRFPDLPEGSLLTLTLTLSDGTQHTLPLRLH